MSWLAGYTEVRELGRGASGRVMLATHDATGTSVAVKYLADELGADVTRGFRAEARLLAELDDPHVVHLYEYVQAGERSAIVQELVNGVSLQTMLDRNGALSPEAALVVLKGSLLGLGAAHRAGVVHRDYKPANVVVTSSGDTKLIDFGIATRTDRAVPSAGTPDYMAPEQWSGQPPTPATDVYAATGVFVACLTAHPPYAAPGLDALRRQHLNAPPPTGDVPEPVRSIVASGMAKDPARRPADAAAFLAELERVAAAAYGPDWEDRGREHLGKAALLLALLFPLTQAAWDGIGAFALTILGRREALIGAGIVVAVLLGTTAVTAATPTSHHSAHATSSAFASATPPGSAAPGSTTPGRSTPTATGPHPRHRRHRPTTTTTTATATRTPPLPPPISTSAPATSPHSTPHTTTPPPPPPTTAGVYKVAIAGVGPDKATAQASIHITGPGPVTITFSYSDGTVSTFTAPAGSTIYPVNDTHLFPDCIGTWSVTVNTSPASTNGAQGADTAAVC